MGFRQVQLRWFVHLLKAIVRVILRKFSFVEKARGLWIFNLVRLIKVFRVHRFSFHNFAWNYFGLLMVEIVSAAFSDDAPFAWRKQLSLWFIPIEYSNSIIVIKSLVINLCLEWLKLKLFNTVIGDRLLISFSYWYLPLFQNEIRLVYLVIGAFS